MRDLAWQEDFSVGVAAFDNDHRRIIALVQSLVAHLPEGEPLDALLTDLRDVVDAHVAREEDMLRRLAHPAADDISREHREQEAALLTVMAMIARQGHVSEDAGAFLETWVLHHIVCHDLDLRRFLRERGACDLPAPGETGSAIVRLSRRLDFLGLRWRILLIAVLPLLAVVAASAFGIVERVGTARHMSHLRDVTVFSAQIGGLVHGLQRERGLSMMYMAGPTADISAALRQQRAETDGLRQMFELALRQAGRELGPDRLAISLPRLDVLRSQLDRRDVVEAEVVGHYGGLIADLLHLVQRTVYAGAASDIVSDASAYVLLMRSKERAGSERAAGAAGLANNAADPASYLRFLQLSAEQRMFEQEFLSTANATLVDSYRAILTGPDTRVARLRDNILATLGGGRPENVTAQQWFQASSERIDAMKRVEDEIARHIIIQAEADVSAAWREIAWLCGAALVLLIAVVAPTLVLAASVVPPLTALHRAMQGLAAGDHTVAISGVDQRDEIGAMARTVRSFREGLITRDLLSLQARLEVSNLARSIADNLPGILFQQARGRDGAMVCTYVSEKVQHYTGRAPDALVGRAAPDGLMVRVHPEDQVRVAGELAAAVGAGTAMLSDFRIVMPHDEEGWLRVAMAPRQTTEGTVIWDGVALDVTELKDSERQRAAAATRLRQLYKLQALTQLAGGMAHEINNLLQPIIGLSELALLHLPEDAKVRRYIQNVLLAGQQARDLVAKITSFSRIEPLERDTVNLADTVEKAMSILQDILPRNVALHIQVEDRDTTVLANAGELQQVLMNLCTNAAHAIGAQSGSITVSTARVEEPDGSAWATLEVADTGCGIDEAIIERIFDPFFTTKEVGQGTGMGLALVNSLITGFGGHIEVDSRPGRGTLFTIHLPMHAPASTTPAPTL